MVWTNAARSVIHMDLDAFFVSVECLRDKRLLGQPLIIGGSSSRGVVASCSYEARKYGVHSAMPTQLALQLCPDALVISGDMEAYSRYSSMVTEIIREESPLFEKASIDEFYLDVSGMDKYLGDTFLWARELRGRIIHETGLPISMGLSINKLISKVATGEYKPNGEKHVERGTERDFIAPMPISKLPMIGKKTAQFLMDMGVTTVQALRDMPLRMLQAAFGKNGTSLWKKANAVDDSPVVPYSERKSISTECTFGVDSIDVVKMKNMLVAMIEKLAFKLRSDQKLASCITVKLRYSNFDTVTRQAAIPYTASDQALTEKAMALFDKLYTKRMLIRLVGIRLSGLVHGHYQINLFEDTEERVNLYQAMDKIKHKHGSNKLTRASIMDVSGRVRIDNNIFQGK